jgi:hypothetical protein
MGSFEAQIASAPQNKAESQLSSASYWAPGVQMNTSAREVAGSNAQDHLPGISLTDGDHVLLAGDLKSAPLFKLGAENEQFLPYVDQQGIAPFGGATNLIGEVGKGRSQSYYSASIGLDGLHKGGEGKQVLNINIGDAMKVDGKLMADGANHRGVFPIAPDKDGREPHWKWIDATIQADGKGGSLTINRVSKSETRPMKDSDWDDFTDMKYSLRHQSMPQHVSADEYWTMYRKHDNSEVTENLRSAHTLQALRFAETSK